ncbi:farnesyl pyrophosphate synthetase, putative [Perkinsus marinus ATCC 50983]|uniref:Farnesyl pyrophosphate synthetase, putative n=1 Tax=Perkinsus marinus (strain ATCC 50983 / TXsc) TaxID=423536 RepID=C5K589_PERM5|nr:farnesyl pyrophosphate synthetase, putative [Perkinsus marinus ATCC 50983]EER20511.1 farnesyl pyrophosphate synthetase, putative [Perkinsus marinus ATCC 50983]|eukprot:XP_002788715.1 farnesyl pyrophosphate synthetase, putative [Perkinsus marinus ATCC 50983]
MPHNTLTLSAAHAEKVVMNSSSGHAGRGDIQDDSIRQMFLDAYPRARETVIQGIGAYLDEGGLGPDNDVHIGVSHDGMVCNYFERCMNYNCLGGKMTRGLTTVATYVALCGDSCEHVKDAAAIGWSAEFLQASFLMFDDVMDQSETRRGSTCWYRLPEISMPNSLNDVVFIENAVYTLLIESTGFDADIKLAIIRLCHDITLRTIIGQHLDLNSVRPDDYTVDLSRYTMERYWATTAYKTAYYSFWLPVALGMAMARFPLDDPDYKGTKDACILLGNFFQAQDDFLDVFGDPEVIGKVGTDIKESKCSYVFLKARELLETSDSCESKASLERLNKLYSKKDKTGAEVDEIKCILAKSGVEQAFRR